MMVQASALSMSALDPLGLMARRKDLPDDLACFLQQQKQRQARLETTMRSFPSTGDMAAADAAAADKIQDQKKKRSTHEVSHAAAPGPAATQQTHGCRVLSRYQQSANGNDCKMQQYNHCFCPPVSCIYDLTLD